MSRTSTCAHRARVAFVLLACACGVPAAWSATITVDNSSSGSVFGACTLQDAVISADTDQPAPGSTCTPGEGADTIVFAPGIDHIVLTAPGSLFDPSALVVSAPLTIDGGAVENSGTPKVTIERGSGPTVADFRLIEATDALTLRGVALVNGRLHDPGLVGSGAGIKFAPPSPDVMLTLADSAVDGGSATGDSACGGGIFLQRAQSVTMTHSRVSQNRLSGAGAYGGGVCVDQNSALVLHHSLIDANVTTGANSRGGGFYSAGILAIDDSIISNNQVQGFNSRGGGIDGENYVYFYNASALTGNSAVAATSDGGGAYVNSAFVVNQLLLAPQGFDDVRAVRVNGNTAGRYGGGLVISPVEYLSNLISYLLVDANVAGEAGGGIYLAAPAPIGIDNSTISGNRVTAADGVGGGIATVLQDGLGTGLTLSFVTIAANSVASGALGAGLYVNNSYVNADSTLIYGNTGGYDIDTTTHPLVLGGIEGPHNLFGTHGTRIAYQAGTLTCDPQLGALADNGGGTLTHAIPLGSCAFGAGGTATGDWDQRGAGYHRAIGTPDIGAFEAQSVVPVNGVCGNDNGVPADSPPVNLCSAGTPTTVQVPLDPFASPGPASFTWQCRGQTGGSTANCAAPYEYLTVNVVVGAHGSVLNCNPNPCVALQSDSWGNHGYAEAWDATLTLGITPDPGYAVSLLEGCGGSPSGGRYTTAPLENNCAIIIEFSNVQVDGVCGPDNGKALQAPPQNTCSNGIASAIAGNGPWTWTCSSANGGATASCASASPQLWQVSVVDAQTPTQFPAHGQIQGGNPQDLPAGSPAAITLLPDPGYMVVAASGCGGSLSGNVYTTQALAAPCTVLVSFVPQSGDGVCGSDNGRTLSSPPTALCNAGIPSAVIGSGPWIWSCGGLSGGTTAACMAQYGTATTTWTVTPKVTGGSGTISPSGAQTVNDGAIVAFTLAPASGYAIGSVSGCGGSLSGNVYTTGAVNSDCEVDATFSAQTVPVDGVCGADDGKTLNVAPTNLCNAGTASAVSGTGPWTWTCAGIGGGSTASCSALATRLETATSVSADPNPASAGQNVVISVLVSSLGTHASSSGEMLSFSQSTPQATPVPSGSAVVTDGTVSCTAALVNGAGSCVLVFTVAGSHVLTATYGGDTNYAASSSMVQLLIIADGVTATVSAPAVSWWGIGLLTLLICVSALNLLGTIRSSSLVGTD